MLGRSGQTTPITVYETQYVEAQMRMIAVNDSFICYGIRNGLIRVFSRQSGNVRSLLRGHSESIAALKFLADTDVLLSVDVRGRVTVRKLTLDLTNEDINSQTFVDFEFNIDASATGTPPSACWLPLDARKPGRCEFALSAGTCVVCYECAFIGSAKGTDRLVTISLDAPPAMNGLQVIEFDAPVSCVDSAPEGRKLVAASEGRAYVLVKEDGEDEFECTDTLPWTVETALFASAERVILGNNNNTELVVVDVTQPTPVAVQRVVFTSANDKCFNVSLQHDTASGIVMLSNTRMNTVFALHFRDMFDYVTRFETSQPVLSFDSGKESDAEGDAIKLFCLQTQAIQTLRMPIDACVPPAGLIPSTPKNPSKLSTSSSGLLTPDMFMGAELAGDEDEDDVKEEDGVSGHAKGVASNKTQAPAYDEEDAEEEYDVDDDEEMVSAAASGATTPAAIPIAAAAVDIKQLRAAIRGEMQELLEEIRSERRQAAEERKADMERARKANETAAANLKRDVTNAIATLLQQHGDANAKTIEAGVARAQSVAATSAQTAMKSIVGPAIDSAVRAQMETSVVPRFELACGEMFKQVKATFEKGMADLNTELLAARESAVLSQTQPLVSGLRAATSEVRQAATVLLTDVPNQVAAAMSKVNVVGAPSMGPPPGMATKSAPRSLAQIEQQLDPTVEISKLLQSNQIDKAFNFALSLSKVEVVMWLVNQVSSDRIFAQTPCPLSQGVLLSLVQQLSTNLNTPDAPKKLDWIRDACLAVDPANPALKAHMKPVLSAVHQALMAAANSPAAAPEVRAGTRLCIHVVNSMLTACQ